MTNQQRANPKEQNAKRWLGVIESVPYLGPQTVHFDIANGCNVRCTTCWHHSPELHPDRVPSAQWKKQQLSFESFQGVFDQLIDLGGLQHIILSGMGDPSLNSRLVDMVRYAQSHGIHVTIITNLLKVDLEQLLLPPCTPELLDLLVSVCGVTEATWNAFHAMPVGFAALVEQLQRLKDAGYQPKHVQVINAQNHHELDQMVRFAHRWSAKRVNFKFASLAHGTERYALSESQKRNLLDVLIPRARAVAEFYGVDTDLDAFTTQVDVDSHRTSPIESVGCYMGTVYCRITVDQELLYCCNTEVSVGHLDSNTTFRDLWFGSRYAAWRERFARGDFLESCHQCGKYKQNRKWAEKLQVISPAGIGASLVNDHPTPSPALSPAEPWSSAPVYTEEDSP